MDSQAIPPIEQQLPKETKSLILGVKPTFIIIFFLVLLSIILMLQNRQLKLAQVAQNTDVIELEHVLDVSSPTAVAQTDNLNPVATNTELASLRAYSIKVGGTKQDESLQLMVYKTLFGDEWTTWSNNRNWPVIYRQYSQSPTEIYKKPFEEKQNIVFYVLSEKELRPNKRYGNELFSVTVLKEIPALVPFLENQDYCKVDADCSIRYNWCEKGGWNDYSAYVEDIGCTAGFNEGQSESMAEQLGCDVSYFPGVVANYSSVRCIENSCVAQNPTFTCPSDTEAWIRDGLAI
jgi:hypothetical protein